MSKIKFLHLAAKITDSMKACLDECPRRGGMYNWMFLFKGNMRALPYVDKKELEEYDVVQMNCSPIDLSIVPKVIKMLENSDTKLILNNDYVCECWDGCNIPQFYYWDCLDRADMVFGTEPHQTSHLIDGSFCMPHPHWIEMIKRHGKIRPEEPDKAIGYQFKWWEGKTYTPFLLLEKIKRKYPKIKSRLYAYIDNSDKSKMYAKAMWDEIYHGMGYPDFINHLTSNLAVYEGCSFHTYGRTTVDTAAIGIPSFGTDRVFSMKHCWPNMIADPYRLDKLKEIFEKILKGGSWLDEQIDYAKKSVEYFNYKNSEKRFRAALDLCKDGKNKREGQWLWNEQAEVFE